MMRSSKSAPSLFLDGLMLGGVTIGSPSSSTSTPSTGSLDENLSAGRDATFDADPAEKKDLMRRLAKTRWQPDAEASKCSMMSCNQEFDRFSRRHHCRVCGRVVCAPCSSSTMLLLPEAGQRGPAKDVRVCDACSHTPSMHACVRTQRLSRPFHGALLATSGLVESLRARASSRGCTSPRESPGAAVQTLGAPSLQSEGSQGMRHSVSMPTLYQEESHLVKVLRLPGDDAVSCATTPTTDNVGHVSAPTTPQTATRDPSHPVHVPRASAKPAFKDTSSRETHLLASLHEDEHAHALQKKFAASSFYQGLLHHEPAALKALIRSAADQLRDANPEKSPPAGAAGEAVPHASAAVSAGGGGGEGGVQGAAGAAEGGFAVPPGAGGFAGPVAP